MVEHSHDPDALFISKVENYDESVELSNELILDFDINVEASALEILDSSKVFNV